MPSNQKTSIPAVPIRTPMFDADGNVSRTWMIFFEKLGNQSTATLAGGQADLVQESVFGARDGSNRRFTTSFTPAVSRETHKQIVILELNGVELTPFRYNSEGYGIAGGDYAISGNVITMVKAPLADDYLIATYIPNVPNPTVANPMVAAALSMVTEWIPNASGGATGPTPQPPVANASLWDIDKWSTGAPGALNVGYIGFGKNSFISANAAYAQRTDTLYLVPGQVGYNAAAWGIDSLGNHAYDVTTADTLLSTLVLEFYQWNSQGGFWPLASYFNIYDVRLQITLQDGTLTQYFPNSWKTYNTGSQAISPTYSTGMGNIANIGFAGDNDLASYAQMQPSPTGTFSPVMLILKDWSPVPVVRGIADKTRGNIAYSQVKASDRKADGVQFQMAGDPRFTQGNVLVFDKAGNAVDGGVGGTGIVVNGGDPTVLVNSVAASYDNIYLVNGA